MMTKPKYDESEGWTQVEISKAALDAIRSRAKDTFVSNAVQVSEGVFSITLQHRTLSVLKDYIYEGETLSDTIIRISRRFR